MANRIFNCTLCNDNSPITFVADDDLVPLYNGIPANRIIGLNTDGSFDEGFIYGTGLNGEAQVIEMQNDGKILIGGIFTSYNDDFSKAFILRLNQDGSVDNSFTTGAINGSIFSIKIQPDGKILLGGNFSFYFSTFIGKIVRLNQDGSIDTTFNSGTGFFGSRVSSIELQQDGKILVGGDFSSYSGVSSNAIIRLNTNGSVDNTFVYGTGFNTSVKVIKIQPDGKILVGGPFSTYNGILSPYLIRLNTNGSVDGTFNGGGFNSLITTIELQNDGKILVGGFFTMYNLTVALRIVRLNTDGSIDNTFITGMGFNGYPEIIKLQPDNKILAGGYFVSYNNTPSNYVIRLNTDGTIDTTFEIGTGFNGGVTALNLQSNGGVIISGAMSSYRPTFINRFVRLESDATLDNTFNYGLGFDGSVNTIVVQSDDKILVGGNFTNFDNIPNFGIIRFNSNSVIDNTFSTGTGFEGRVNIIVIQSDGKILVGGSFNSYNGTTTDSIIRLNSDGSIDGTFNYGTGFRGFVNTIKIQSNGKILIGGEFTEYNGTIVNNIIRLNSDGTVDGSFIFSEFDGPVTTIELDLDEKILVGGSFSRYGLTNTNNIISLNTDGSVNLGFDYGTGTNGKIWKILTQPDGKILVGGEFSEYNTNLLSFLIRLNPDGTVDNTFQWLNNLDSYVYTIFLQSDGKILLGGEFTNFSPLSARRIVRLNPDGTYDDSFDYGTGFNIIVLTITQQSDGKLLIGGDFTEYYIKSGVFQLVDGNCVSIDTYDIVSRNPVERFFTFGPFESCSECITPDDSPGIESIICVSCDDPESVTGTTVPHGIYLDERGRAIAQINTVGIGGFNGLNN